MRIAIFIYSMSGGGAERVISYLLSYLQERGHQIHLVLMNNTISYDIQENIPIHYIEKSKHNENGVFKLIKLPFLAYKYNRLIKSLNITHSFSLLARPSYINLISRWCFGTSSKTIISERSYPSLQYGYENLQSKINKELIKCLYPKADKIICNSRGNVEDLILNFGIDTKDLVVIHNPIDIDTIQKIAPIDNFYDANYFNVITIGRLDEGKNHELLIKSVEHHTKVRLYILGEGRLKGYLVQQIKDKNLEDRVFLLGFDNNPYKYLKEADLFMFGSNHEGFPNVLLEAMCCGLPILSTNCKSGPNEILNLKEEIVDDIMITDYGILTPVNDCSLMKKGLDYIIKNPLFLDSCRKNVLERVKDFDKNKILKTYETVLLK